MDKTSSDEQKPDVAVQDPMAAATAIVGPPKPSILLPLLMLVIIVYSGYYGWMTAIKNPGLITQIMGIIIGLNVGTILASILVVLIGFQMIDMKETFML